MGTPICPKCGSNLHCYYIEDVITDAFCYKCNKNIKVSYIKFKNMNKIESLQVKLDYELACDNYAKLFCKKHGYDFKNYGSWSGIGEWFDTGADIIVSMQTIKDDIDNDLPEKELLPWYDYIMRLNMLDCKRGRLNYKSWCKGAPRISEDELIKMEESQVRIEELKDELKKLIDGDNF